MLAEGLRSHRGPLSASLWAEYGIDVEASPVGAWRLADMVAALPAGCAFWKSVGGPLAWSDTEHMMAILDYRLRELQWLTAGNKSAKRPEPPKMPPYAHEAVDAQKELSKAQRRFEERFG